MTSLEIKNTKLVPITKVKKPEVLNFVVPKFAMVNTIVVMKNAIDIDQMV